MTMHQCRVLPKTALPAFLRRLRSASQMIGPVRRGGRTVWARIEANETPLLEFTNTPLSPKELFLPQTECLLRFGPDGVNTMREPEQDRTPRLLMNIRPCDARAFAVLDRVFRRGEPDGDPYWLAGRERTTLVGLACSDPCTTCFCTATQCGPHNEEGLDLLLVDLGDRFLIRVLTEKGADLVRSLPAAGPDDLREGGEQKRRAEQQVSDAAVEDAAQIGRRGLPELFELEIWERLAETCLNCGACTFVCPTCHCFDIQDETKGPRGRRVRTWDTCMSPLFTRHASGHNPRGSKKSRVRQRFLHKLSYMPSKRAGDVGCVGCGRCITACPVNIDIREVLESACGRTSGEEEKRTA
jgi:sulfhydrogenase subunit beta (sulfur reductase)